MTKMIKSVSSSCIRSWHFNLLLPSGAIRREWFELIYSKRDFVGHHDDGIKWKHFPRYWPFVWGIHRSPVNSRHKGQWRGALMFSLICAWIKWLSKQSWGLWLETPSRILWRHCNVTAILDDTTERWKCHAIIEIKHVQLLKSCCSGRWPSTVKC